MTLSEKIRLYPTAEQEQLFWSFAGAARFVYNKCLSYKIDIYQNTNYSCKIADLLHYIQELKYNTSDYAWLQSIPEAIAKQAIKDLDKAYSMFFKRGNNGFPKFKKRSTTTPSFYQRTDGIRMLDEQHIKLTGVKTPVRIRKHCVISKWLNPRVSFDGKFWYLSYSYEIEPQSKSDSTKVIGVDLGVKSFAVTSDNTVYPNINRTKTVQKLEQRKNRLQRKLSKKYLLNKQGNKFVKTNNIIKLEEQIRLIDRKLKNIRNTYIHTVTSELVKAKPSQIVIEDLNVSGMLKNKHLSKAIQQQGFYKFREYLTYKCELYGVILTVADRFYASSKTCSNCSAKRKTLALSERTFVCSDCGCTIDRDLNAAINLRNYGLNLQAV